MSGSSKGYEEKQVLGIRERREKVLNMSQSGKVAVRKCRLNRDLIEGRVGDSRKA